MLHMSVMCMFHVSLVPEDVRATIMTFFRIPLNIIVVLTLTNVGSGMGHRVTCGCHVSSAWHVLAYHGMSDHALPCMHPHRVLVCVVY